ncbi:MAG: 50S ribosomal protein L25 [Clostridia bacterium]|jgi:large subunit ribosomal protein L25
MQESVLTVNKRSDKPKVLRRKGIVPGVLYGDKFAEGIPIEFDKAAFSKIVSKHGTSAKISIEFDEKKKLGIIKEIQKDAISQEPIHVDLFMISQSHDLRMKIPVIFTGVSVLERKEWLLQTYGAKIDISGKPNLMPESIVIDVSERQLHDSIKVSELELDDALKIHNDPNEIIASVSELKRKAEVVEEVEEGAEGAPEAEAEKSAAEEPAGE